MIGQYKNKQISVYLQENILSFWPERELGVDDECVAGHHHAAWRILSFLHIVIVSVLLVINIVNLVMAIHDFFPN